MRLARTGLGIVLLALATTALPAAGGAHDIPDIAGRHSAHAGDGTAKVHTSKLESGLSWRRAAAAVATDQLSSCGLHASGRIECWGWATRLGVPPTGSFTAVTTGFAHACGLGIDGRVECWGINDLGQASAPTGTFADISAGFWHACGLLTDGQIECWGGNDHGQASPPTGTFTAVSAGDGHSCALRTGGNVECWGDDEYGQATPPTGTFTAVSAGAVHSCGLLTDGQIECWGYDRREAGPFLDDVDPTAADQGQDPSRSTTAPCVAPLCFLGRASPPAGAFTAVSAGSLHGCGLRTDGQVACWGFNEHGQASPPAGAFIAVSAALWHTCGLRIGGEIECWGDDYFGQASPPAGTFATAFHFMCVLQAAERSAC